MKSDGLQKWVPSFMLCLVITQTCVTASDVQISLPGCSNKCGDVVVPYPFGIDLGNCSKSFEFFLICNRSTNPAKLTFIGFSVLHISPEEGLMIVSLEAPYNCYDSSGSATFPAYDFISGSDKYRFSYTRNKFVTLGCDTLAYVLDPTFAHVQFSSGCVSLCQDTVNLSDKASCSGVGCCQTSIPKGLHLLVVKLSRSNNSTKSANPCGYAFLVEQDSFQTIISKNLTGNPDKSFETPVALDWFTDNKTCTEARLNASTYACGPNSICTDSSNGPGYLCSCKDGFQGNAYLPQGCQDIDECSNPMMYPCHGSCRNTIGNYTCRCPLGMHGDGKVSCRGIRIGTLALGICLSFGLMFLLVGLYFIHKMMKKKNHARLKKKYFEKNGGMLFEQQITLSTKYGGIERSKIFTAEELDKATDHYNENRILGRGGQGTVYKGMLSNGTIVAIKKSVAVRDDDGQIEQFINEVVILSQINHKHVVRLLGCCLETEVPLLVYEFISNGTLSGLVHHQKDFRLPWADRLRIAKEVAGALAYLHSAASIPIYHRDIKSSNILLDEKLRAKIADFGISRSISSEQTHLTTLVQGTFGYLDPEYFRSNQFTDKSDVYSYGVVLMELLTGRKPISSNVTEEEMMGLAAQFVSAMEGDRLFDVVDPQVGEEGDQKELIIVANLAKRCVELSGRRRPAMSEVALELEKLKCSKNFLEERCLYLNNSGDWDADTTLSESLGTLNTNELELPLCNNGVFTHYY